MPHRDTTPTLHDVRPHCTPCVSIETFSKTTPSPLPRPAPKALEPLRRPRDTAQCVELREPMSLAILLLPTSHDVMLSSSALRAWSTTQAATNNTTACMSTMTMKGLAHRACRRQSSRLLASLPRTYPEPSGVQPRLHAAGQRAQRADGLWKSWPPPR